MVFQIWVLFVLPFSLGLRSGLWGKEGGKQLNLTWSPVVKLNFQMFMVKKLVDVDVDGMD